MDKQFETGLVWFRRDLRTRDCTALNLAFAQCRQVHCVFVFDRSILDPLPRVDRRVEFIRESLLELDISLRQLAGHDAAGLIVLLGTATQVIPELAQSLGIQALFVAHDYEPQAVARDDAVCKTLTDLQIEFISCKDQVIFEKQEILTQSGTPYGVFTPYKNAWLKKLSEQPLSLNNPDPAHACLARRPEQLQRAVPSLAEIGFSPSNLRTLQIPTGQSGAQKLLENFLLRIDQYHETRDFPAIRGPSYLSMHLRFGTISIRELVILAYVKSRQGSQGAAIWLSELIWREFYFQILFNFPHVATGAYRPAYDAIEWEEGELALSRFSAWCQGQTGYPLVDAAMAQINQTGYMHNRLRMVVGSFLVKDLGIDWRWGERYFAEQLNDFDLAANNGGWQWVSSSGCDAQPYFRIFNPVSQSEKFDPNGKFIRRYLPQLNDLSDKDIHSPWTATELTRKAAGVVLGENYPSPVVAHQQARATTLLRYSVVKK
jgi:deoxyribodipyrimidine photo-lyase